MVSRFSDKEVRKLLLHYHLDGFVVTRAQREQGDIFIAGIGQGPLRQGKDCCGCTFAHRAIDHPGLAETAPLRATAADFKAQAIVDRVAKGNKGSVWIGGLVQVCDQGLAHGRISGQQAGKRLKSF